MNVAGVSLSVSGVAFAIWARRHLGTNWSLNPSLKEDHQLVTSGPYRFLRHPIYTGMLTGLLGSLLATFSPVWFYLLIVMIVTFIYRVHVEDNMMMQTFPEAYAAYKKKTKALIPFVW
jgi:protein-S-isoprenylcysteine O-methyltransferase